MIVEMATMPWERMVLKSIYPEESILDHVSDTFIVCEIVGGFHFITMCSALNLEE